MIQEGSKIPVQLGRCSVYSRLHQGSSSVPGALSNSQSLSIAKKTTERSTSPVPLGQAYLMRLSRLAQPCYDLNSGSSATPKIAADRREFYELSIDDRWYPYHVAHAFWPNREGVSCPFGLLSRRH
jgi:hypothetical protein